MELTFYWGDTYSINKIIHMVSHFEIITVLESDRELAALNWVAREGLWCGDIFEGN